MVIRGRFDLKAECEAESCGYTVLVAVSQIKNVGLPHCPKHGAMAVDMAEDDTVEKPEMEELSDSCFQVNSTVK